MLLRAFPAPFFRLLIEVSRHHVALEKASLHAAPIAFMLRIESIKEGGAGSRLIIIVHKVHFPRASVSSPRPPVIDHIIPDVKKAGIVAVPVHPARQAPVPAVTVGQQVMVK